MNNLETIQDVTLPDSFGKDTRIGDLWKEQPAVICWLRHYG